MRIAIVGLASGELRYVTGRGVLIDRDDRPLGDDGSVPVVDAVRASCALPAIYPPIRLGEEHYIDGGTRENLPVDIAVSQLRVAQCYAIVALPKGLPTEESFAGRDMLSVVLRSTSALWPTRCISTT